MWAERNRLHGQEEQQLLNQSRRQSPAKVLFCSHLIIKTIPLLLSSPGLRAPDSLGPVIASLLIGIISIYYPERSGLFQLSL